MPIRLQVSDTFSEWLDKINDFMDTDVLGSFEKTETNPIPLGITIKAGQFRRGSNIISMPQTTVVLSPNKVYAVGVFTREGEEAIVSYELSNLPDKYFIPAYHVTTNATTITESIDVRTWANVSGSTSQSEAILEFDKVIDKNKTISSTKNALSISPTIADGVTVIVSNGSIWVIQ